MKYSNDFLDWVKNFHLTFKAPVLEIPQIPSKNRCDLRVNLIQEELNELNQALKDNDLTEVLDACGDLMVVLLGSIHEFGLGNVFNEAFREIHNSNMSKACSTEEEANLTIQHYLVKDGTISHFEKVDDKWIVYRSSDNKILKSINYTPADMKKFLIN